MEIRDIFKFMNTMRRYYTAVRELHHGTYEVSGSFWTVDVNGFDFFLTLKGTFPLFLGGLTQQTQHP